MSITPRFSALVQHSAPELEKRCRPHLKACTDSWKGDETSIKVKKVWMYLYRAVDSQGNTLEFLLSVTRDAEAAKRFFVKALGAWVPQAATVEVKATQPTVPTDLKASRSAPHVINVEKNAAYPKASRILPASVELRQVKYVNNLMNRTTASSNGWSNRDWASFLLKRHGEPYRDMRSGT